MSTMALEDEVVMPTQEASIICVRHGPTHHTCGVYSKGKNQSYVQRLHCQGVCGRAAHQNNKKENSKHMSDNYLVLQGLRAV